MVVAELFGVSTAALKVIGYLNDLRTMKKHNDMIIKEIDTFITSLEDNVDRLKNDPPKRSGEWVLVMERDLNEVASELGKNLENFHTYWVPQVTTDNLERLRRRLINKMQLTLAFASFKVVTDTDGKLDTLLTSMDELLLRSSAESHSESTKTNIQASIRTIMQPLVVEMKRQDCQIQDVARILKGKAIDNGVETSTELQKFLADVLFTLESFSEQERDGFLDPFECNRMTDPVKCTDGRTYDRFSVVRYNETQRTPLVIAFDDLDVRDRLFAKFDDAKTEFHDKRGKYRDDALELAREGQSAEALSMLKIVLQWAPTDEECREKSAKLEQKLAEQQRTVELAEQKRTQELAEQKRIKELAEEKRHMELKKEKRPKELVEEIGAEELAEESRSLEVAEQLKRPVDLSEQTGNADKTNDVTADEGSNSNNTNGSSFTHHSDSVRDKSSALYTGPRPWLTLSTDSQIHWMAK